MRELAAKDIPNERKIIPKPEALELYRKQNQEFKCELVEEKADEPMVSFYTTGNFIDFCRGPHIPSTGRIKAFKLMSVAGAYWKGQEGNPQMQRIYGACFVDQKELDEYLHKLEEAKRRDHRKLGKELDLFSIQEEAGPGLIFWHPKGGIIRRQMEDWLRDELVRRGYELVYTPHIMRWISGKSAATPNFTSENMFGPMEVEKDDYQLKPMNCPGHILIYKSRLRSYRELPVPPRRTWHRLSLRAFGRAARIAARPRLHAGRRAHFLHAGANRKGSSGLRRVRLGSAARFRLRPIRSGAFRAAIPRIPRITPALLKNGNTPRTRSPIRSSA